MAQLLRDPVLINSHQLFDEGQECIPVEGLPQNESAGVQAVLEGVSYRKGKSRGARVHTFHIHFGSKERYFAVLVSVSLHTLEDCLGIMQNGRGRVNS